MGKKVVSIIKATLGRRPYPSHKTKRGAMATVGTVWVRMIMGYTDFSNRLNLSINTAITNPSAVPTDSPNKASIKVVFACPINKEKSFTKAITTSKGEGSMYLGTRPDDDMNCQRAKINIKAKTDDESFMMFRNFFFNG
jgi:hypothetical protein